MSGRCERPPVILFGGTTEGRELAERLCAREQRTILSVATEYGREVLEARLLENPWLSVQVGRMDAREIAAMIAREGAELVVDSTHPYADQVTRNVREACAQTGVRRLRCLRPRSGGQDEGTGLVRVSSAEAAAQWLAGRQGDILLTTGSKELAAFAGLADFKSRVYARVLPTLSSLQACLDLGLSGRHIIAMQGPFTAGTSRSQLEEFGCAFLVTKDTGDRGGFDGKIQAAREAGATAIVIERPETESGMDVEQVMDCYEQWRRTGHV